MKYPASHAKWSVALLFAILITLLGKPPTTAVNAIPDTNRTFERRIDKTARSRGPAPAPSDAATQLKAAEAYGRAPLSFEANVGQTDDARVKFLSRGDGCDVFLTATEATFAFFNTQRSNPETSAAEKNAGPTRGTIYSQSQVENIRGGALRISLIGADKAAKVKGVDELPGRTNYFIGRDPGKWRTNIPTYSRVRHQDVYPGVDMVMYGRRQEVEYDFTVAPRAHPEAIRLSIEGAERIEIDSAGDLAIESRAGEIRQLKPVAYQENNGARQEVSCSYVMRDKRDVAFKLGDYDRSKPLTIDPILSYATYLGSSTGPDSIDDIAIDSAGHAYVTGFTGATNFPTTPGSFQHERKGFTTAFVTKLNPGGTSIIYSTYLGGGSYEEGTSIAVDPAGNAYVTGTTGSVDFPTTSGAYKTRFRGGFTDVFVTKLNATGNALVYSTYLGGNGDFDGATGIDLDPEGDAYITGSTQSVNFPITTGAAQKKFRGDRDAFVTKLNSEGSALVYSTYLGGSAGDTGTCIAVDALGNAYIAGHTSSSDFPTRKAFQPALNGIRNAFVTKLNPEGTRFVYSTYLGAGGEVAAGLAVDTAGIACVVGTTYSNAFPTTPDAFQSSLRGPSDLFLTRLNEKGSDVIYSTYLGGSATELSGGVALDSAGNAYVTGTTSSFNFPLANPLQDRKHGSALFKSTDAGATWMDLPVSLPSISSIVPDPRAPSTFYGLSGDLIVKSTDKGDSWVETGRRFASVLIFDPLNPSTIYGLTDMRFFKSTDGGSTISIVADISAGNTLDSPSGLVIDPTNPSTLYVSTLVLPLTAPTPARLLDVPARSPVFKSTDGGGTWFPLDLGVPMRAANAIAIDPRNSSTVYASVGFDIFKTTNGGSAWTAVRTGFVAFRILIDPINTSIAYVTSFSGAYKTTDGGVTWRLLPEAGAFISLTISPMTPTTLYAGNAQIRKSTDGGDHWEVILQEDGGSLTIDPNNESTLYLSRVSLDDAFVTKFNASGSALVYSTYLGGSGSEVGKSIAVDPFGNAYVAGDSHSGHFPVTPSAFQKNAGSFFTGFIARIIDPKRPRVAGASIKGKTLTVTGESFDNGAVILVNDLDNETQNDATLPSTVLRGRKAGKKIAPGQRVTIHVRNADGQLSDAFEFTRSPN